MEEIIQLLTQNEPIAVPIFRSSFYGLRRAELLGLRWSAIDFQNGWIHIETTVVKEKIGDKVVSTIRFHDLRHSCATIVLYLNYTMKDVQQWLGYSNYNFTANTYVHSSKQAQFQMAESFADRLPSLGPAVTVEG